MLNAIEIKNKKKGVHTLATHHTNGSVDVFLPTKLKWVNKGLPFFSREQDGDNIFSDIQIPGGFRLDNFSKTNNLFLYFL